MNKLAPSGLEADEDPPENSVSGSSHPSTWRSRPLTVILVAVFAAFSVYIVLMLAVAGEHLVSAIAAVAAMFIIWIYLSPGKVPSKYLTPGVVLLIIFQLFIVVFSGYIAFTNYGDGHNSTKDDAIRALEAGSRARLPDSPAFAVTIVDDDGEIGLLVTLGEGQAAVGLSDTPLAPVDDAVFDDSGQAVEVEGFRTLEFSEVVGRQAEVADIAVPLSDDPGDGDLRTADGRTAFVFGSVLEYQPDDDVMLDRQTGEIFTNNGEGNFVGPSGEELSPGWRVVVGFENFGAVVNSGLVDGPFLRVLIWNFAFATLAVLLPFALGTFLALTLDLQDLRGRRFYRSAMIIPFMVPAFVAPLIFTGLFNRDFGFVNEVLLNGATVPWLSSAWNARVAVLIVNLWMVYPFMFLITTGALQSIPRELNDAAVIDGAGPWQLFRRVKLPLLLVSVAPLLVASFAYSFNNFTLIYLLTRGGPASIESNIGATDILITLVYKTAFESTSRDYGLASAYSVIIFLIVGAVAVLGLRRTSKLEHYF